MWNLGAIRKKDVCVSDVYPNVAHGGRNSEFVPASADAASRYQVLDGNFDVSSPISPLPSLGSSREGWVRALRGRRFVIVFCFFIVFLEKPPQHSRLTLCRWRTCAAVFNVFFSLLVCFVVSVSWREIKDPKQRICPPTVQLKALAKVESFLSLLLWSLSFRAKSLLASQWCSEAEANFSIRFIQIAGKVEENNILPLILCGVWKGLCYLRALPGQ